jgi:hypothetical protein
MERQGAGDLESALAEAVAAFDAGNHAFGRFVTYAVRPHGAVPPAVQAVREQLQEAALAVPEVQSLGAARDFLAAVRNALDAVEAFLADPPMGYALEEARGAPEALQEAAAILETLTAER